jgi:Na+-driven multidrug efflux pump
MTPTEAILAIAPGIIRTYGISFLLLPFNLYATYYFQAIMKANISLVSSLARGVFISGVMIMVMPLIAGVNAIWYAMLVTEVLVAIFNIHHMIKCTRKLKS